MNYFLTGLFLGAVCGCSLAMVAILTAPKSRYEPYPIEKSVCLDNGFTWQINTAGNRYGGGQCVTASNGLTWRIERE